MKYIKPQLFIALIILLSGNVGFSQESKDVSNFILTTTEQLHNKNCKLYTVENAQHELFMEKDEQREEVIGEIFEFWEN